MGHICNIATKLFWRMLSINTFRNLCVKRIPMVLQRTVHHKSSKFIYHYSTRTCIYHWNYFCINNIPVDGLEKYTINTVSDTDCILFHRIWLALRSKHTLTKFNISIWGVQMTFLIASNSWYCVLSSVKGSHLPIIVMLPFGRQDDLNASNLGPSANLLVKINLYIIY